MKNTQEEINSRITKAEENIKWVIGQNGKNHSHGTKLKTKKKLKQIKRSLFSSSVYSCYLFLISSASVRSIQFLSFIEPIFVWNVPLVSLVFLKISLILTILLFSSISLYWSLGKAFLSLLAILWTLHSNAYIFPFLLCFLLLFFSQLFVRPSQTAILLFLHFFFLGVVLVPVFYTMLRTSVNSSSGTLPIRYKPLNLFVTSTV